MTSALAVVRAPVRHGARGGKHECDKDEADKPLAFHPFTSKLKWKDINATIPLIDYRKSFLVITTNNACADTLSNTTLDLNNTIHRQLSTDSPRMSWV
jgi:hypothetical protein